MEAKTQKYQILSRVKIGSEYFAPEDGETLLMDLDDTVGESLVVQGAAKLVVQKVAKAAEKDAKAAEKDAQKDADKSDKK